MSASVGSLVVVGGVYTWSYQRDSHVTASTPEGFAVGPVVGINVDFVGDLVFICKPAQALIEFKVIRTAGIFDAKRGMKFIGSLSFTNSSHIYRHQLTNLGRDAGSGAVPYFFIIAEMQVCFLLWLEAEVSQRLHCSQDAGNAGLIVQEARADETIVDLKTRIESDEITHTNSQVLGIKI